MLQQRAEEVPSGLRGREVPAQGASCKTIGSLRLLVSGICIICSVRGMPGSVSASLWCPDNGKHFAGEEIGLVARALL